MPFEELNELDAEFAAYCLEHPDDAISIGVAALNHHVQKADIGIRIECLPNDVRVEISKLRAEHIGKLISICGLVRKATAVKPNIVTARYKCARCPAIIDEPQDGHTLTEPMECYKEQEGCGRTAGSTKFKLIAEESYSTDIQKIEVQESPEGLRGGTQPGKITAYLSHEITGRIQPGMRVTLNGILRMKADEKNKSTIMETELEVISYELDDSDIEVTNVTDEDMELIKSISQDENLVTNMVRSVSPGIQGYDIEKEALIYQLVGGVAKELDDGQKMRGDMHILLVGDPGTAKSQLIRYVTELAPRGVYASGKSSSAAGLTAAAVKDDFGDGRWTLEAGALVLADKGMAGVDELDKMTDQDTSSLHEAMEAQQISFNKAGITATLQCRFSLLAGANPKLGRFDDMEPIAGQIKLLPSLLSRFDLIFAFIDKPEPVKDEKIARHIIRGQMRAGALKHIHDNDDVANKILSETETLKPVYDRDTIRKYMAYARAQSPILTDEAGDYIVSRYLSIRGLSKGEGATVPITARQLQAYIRISEAAAKLRLSPYVQECDAKRAVEIVQYYLRKISMDEDGQPDIDRLMTGTGGKERNITNMIKHLIKNAGPISEADIIAECDRKNIDRDDSIKSIRRLIEHGDIYEPRIATYACLG